MRRAYAREIFITLYQRVFQTYETPQNGIPEYRREAHCCQEVPISECGIGATPLKSLESRPAREAEIS